MSNPNPPGDASSALFSAPSSSTPTSSTTTNNLFNPSSYTIPSRKKSINRLSLASDLATNFSSLTMASMTSMTSVSSSPSSSSSSSSSSPSATLSDEESRQSGSNSFIPRKQYKTPSPQKLNSNHYATLQSDAILHNTQTQISSPANQAAAKVLHEMNERAQNLLKSNKLEFKPSNSLPNHSSNSSFDPSSSALHSASARMSGRTATRSAKSLQHRFATVHNKDFAMMDSIDHHYTVHRPSQKSDSLLKENLDPSSRSVDLEQRTHPTHLDCYKQIDNSTGIYLQQKVESVTTEVDLDYTPKSATKSKDNEFTVYNESEYTPPESPTKMFYDTTIGIPSLKIPKTEPVFLKECGPSTKRLSNLIPLSAAKRRKMTAIGDMLEIQRHNQIINPHIRPTSIPSRPLGQRTSDHYQSSNIKQFSISSLGNTQRPIVKSKLCPPGSLRFSNAFVKATDSSSFGFQNLSPTTESFIPTASNTRTSERFIKPNEDDPTVDAEPHAQNYGPSTASLIPRSNLQRSKSINENITSTNNNPANDMIQHLASKRLEQGFESNIPSISALNSEIQVSKGRGHSQHRSITTNIPLVPARSDKTGHGSGKTDALKRSVSVKTVSSSPSSLPHSSTQGSPRLRRRSSKILPSSTSSAPAHSPSVENHASASSAFPSRIPRAISTNGVYNLSGNGSHSSPSHSRSSSSNFSVSNSRPNV